MPAKQTGSSGFQEPYRDRRDDDELWSVVRPASEPTGQRWFLVTALVAVVFGAPWYLPAELEARVLSGLPLWVWISLASAVVLALVSSVAAARFWQDDDE